MEKKWNKQEEDRGRRKITIRPKRGEGDKEGRLKYKL
jgi:hypothetical protein